MVISPIYVNVKYSLMFFGRKSKNEELSLIIVLKVISIYTCGDTEHALEEKIFSLVAGTTCCFALLRCYRA